MKKLLIIIPLAVLILAAFSGCGRDVDKDIELVKELLLNSYFTGDAENTSEGEEETPEGVYAWLGVLGDPPPLVFFWRELDSFVRTDSVEIDGDSAHAFLSANLTGTFHVYNDLGQETPYNRDIGDVTYREVVVKWSKDKKKWYIDKITPLEVKTEDPEHPVKISKVEVTASPSGETFTIDDPLAFYGREELARFLPDDTVTVTVTVENLNDADSGWVFLHHGHRRGKLSRRKYFEKNSTWEFEGTWVIKDDNIDRKIDVRHAAFDLIYWETLWGGEEAEYSSYALCIPYVVMEEGEEFPDGTETEE